MKASEIPSCEHCGESVFNPCADSEIARGCVLRSCRQAKAERANMMTPNRKTKASQEFKADDGKSNPELLEAGVPRALEVANDTLDYGAIKYEAHSWQNVPDAIARYDAAARRHRRARDMGETHDTESFVMHLGHEIICNLFQLELMLRADPALRVPFNRYPPQEHKK